MWKATGQKQVCVSVWCNLLLLWVDAKMLHAGIPAWFYVLPLLFVVSDLCVPWFVAFTLHSPLEQEFLLLYLLLGEHVKVIVHSAKHYFWFSCLLWHLLPPLCCCHIDSGCGSRSLTSFKFILTSIMWYAAGPPSFSLNRRKTIRFWSIILLLAVIGLELTGLTLVRQRKTLLGLRPFAFPLFLLLLIHKSL